MNPARFLRKCLTDRRAAWRSAKLVGRSLYGSLYWRLSPTAPLKWRLAGGGILLLEPQHSFTHCFWPAVDAYEPDVRAALRKFLRPDATFVDCGANIGYFSVLAGTLVGPEGRVLAIEANPVTYELLTRNLAINGIGTAVNCALSATAGDCDLFVPRAGGDVYSSLRQGGLVTGDDVERITVRGRTLDELTTSLQIRSIDVLKVDIEGGELDVLRSASHILKSMRPVVICEYGTNTWPAFNATVEGLLELLADCGYSSGVFDLQSGNVRRTTEEDWRSPYLNLVLQPRSA